MDSLPYGTPIDLSNCEREPIHIPGHVQEHGALWVVDRDTRRVLQCTDNVASFVNRSPEQLLGSALSDLLPERAFRSLFEPDAPQGLPRHLLAIDLGCGELDVIAHVDGPLVVFEVERAPSADPDAPSFFDFASRVISGLGAAATGADYAQRLAEALRTLTGYDRVMIYRFAHDWSGEVFAESMAPDRGLHPYLGLHYPASDIPAQARALFHKNTVRMLPLAGYTPARCIPERNPRTGQPLDMSHTFLRGASQMYTEYLVNMGVTATLTLALSRGAELWGLVACHHYTPRRISHGQRVVCELLAKVASLQIMDRVRADEARYRERLQRVHAALVDQLAYGERLGGAMARFGDDIRGMFDSGGVVIVSAAGVDSQGEVPPPHHLQRLISTLLARRDGRVLALDHLAALYPDAAEIADVAAGLLMVPLPGDGEEFVLWFRPAVERTVHWAGDPHKPVTVGPLGDRLTPRKSFELWVETVRGRSAPWTDLELGAAEQLRVSFVEIDARRFAALERLNRELARSNAELDAFAYAASHDIKEPLRGINNHAAFLRRELGEREPAAGERLERISRLATRLHDLVDALLEFSRLGRATLRRERVEVADVVAAAIEEVGAVLQERGVNLTVAPELPRLYSSRTLLRVIFANLISNAAKYGRAEAPRIAVGAVAAGEAGFPVEARGFRHAFFVRDNGIGVRESFRIEVFEIFRRLHGATEYGGGTGAGLTIVKKAVERLGGVVWLGDGDDGGTTAWFTVETVEAGEDLS
jgi:two-component system, chemotaxis family, sensor kinase Cph1